MKNTIKILLGAIGLLFIGCQPDITELPQDRLTPPNFFRTEVELQLWTNEFYTIFDDAGDIARQTSDVNINNYLSSLMEGQRSPANEKGWNFDKLRDINYYFEHSSNCKDESVRKHYDGIAHFFRAYFYFEKVRKYGAVPYYTEVIGSKDEKLLKMPRTNRDIVMKNVIKDLDKAIEMLPASKNEVRVTKWTALALKSRVALFEGTFRKYHNMENSDFYLQECVKAGKEFINTSGYRLYTKGNDPYRSLFDDTSKEKDLSDEIILQRVYGKEANVTNSIQFEIVNGRQGLTRKFVNHYLMADGKSFTSQPNWQTEEYLEQVKNRDPRLAQTILTPTYVQQGNPQASTNTLNALTGFQPIKYVASTAYNGAGSGIINLPLFRSAEVYLNYAEAKAELGTITQEDLDMSINKIRQRAHMPDMNLAHANSNIDELLLSYYPNVTKGRDEGVILEIRRERTVELVMEGFRQWDLLRWKEGKAFGEPFEGLYFPGVGKYDMNGDGTPDIMIYKDKSSTNGFRGRTFKLGADIVLTNGDSGYMLAYPNNNLDWQEDRDYLWPIPAEQRVLSDGALTQNPNWQDGLSF